MKNKNLLHLLYLLLIASMLFLNIGCSEDETTAPPATVDETDLLVKYLEANGDFINTSAPAMIAASDVYTNVITLAKDWPIIDIRAAADFTAGHIDGAVNVTLADLVNYYKNNNLETKEKVVITCYTGQSAAWGTTVLRMLGYSNVFDLKYGMSSWNEQFANRWRNSIGNGKAAQFVTTNYPKPAVGNLPVLSTGKTTGAEILEARIQTLLTEGFGAASISNGDLYLNLSNYFIVNYWSLDHYNWGHIEGAIQYTPKSDLKLSTNLKTLPTDKPIVVYCYTGQTSGHVAAYLRLLGYNAKSLSFGVNAMSYDNMPGTKWLETDVNDYPFVTGN
ncbi:MAG: rhodanese-like domain-containing protein [Ignavibacteriaceae bacterium]